MKIHISYKRQRLDGVNINRSALSLVSASFLQKISPVDMKKNNNNVLIIVECYPALPWSTQ